MPTKFEHDFSAKNFKSELEEHGNDPVKLPGWIFEGLFLYTDLQLANDASLTDKDPTSRTKHACNIARFAGARLTSDLKEGITHVLVGEDRSTTTSLRRRISE